jgi:hypothetical protein
MIQIVKPDYRVNRSPGSPPCNSDRWLAFAMKTLLAERPNKGFLDSPKTRLWTICADLRCRELVYGLWVTGTGRVVAFNRYYNPIWQRQMPDGEWERADRTARGGRGEWVEDIVREMWFYIDIHREQVKVDRALDIMVRLGILQYEQSLLTQKCQESIEAYAVRVEQRE